MSTFKRIIAYFIPIFLICFSVHLLYKWNYIQHSEHYPDEFNIPKLGTGSDTDGDMIEDSEDIMINAKNYIARRPEYKDNYYQGGWPNDNKGTAGDVIAWAFKDAGYDLRNLIWQDVTKNPEIYGENVGDQDIAFRRVENQRIFMSRYFDEHTTDYEDIIDWQQGDVIFFEKGHVALVADKVNGKGIRFIIHHFWRYQAGYYQDVLETNAWGKIVGHYRVSKRALTPKTDHTTKTKAKTI